MNLFFRSPAARLRRSRPAARPRRRLTLETLEKRTVLSGLGDTLLPPPALGAAGVVEGFGEDGGATTGSEYEATVIARGLMNPTGITAARLRGSHALFFTQLPEPGVPMGSNTVNRLSLASGRITELTRGEPEPTNIVQDRHGTVYWTCKSAGVILRQTLDGDTQLVLRDLEAPTGISVSRDGRTLYFTEVPTPGVSGGMGGRNKVSKLDLRTGATTLIDFGDPEPTDIVVAPNGDLFWTCKSAGVIVGYNGRTGESGVLLRDLRAPTGIALEGNDLYFTEVPTPGVSGAMGGMNRVSKLNLRQLRTTLVDFGDPEPTDVTVDRDGTVYWTCTSAGVIVAATRVPDGPGESAPPGRAFGVEGLSADGDPAGTGPVRPAASPASARDARLGEVLGEWTAFRDGTRAAAGGRGRDLYFADLAAPGTAEVESGGAGLADHSFSGPLATDAMTA